MMLGFTIKDGHKYLSRDVLEMLAFPSTLDGKRYLNVIVSIDKFTKEPTPKTMLASKPPLAWTPKYDGGYNVCKYDLTNNVLTLEGMNGEAVKAAIKAGKLGGREQEHGYLITEPTDRLAAFVVANHDRLFPGKDVLTLHRVK